MLTMKTYRYTVNEFNENGTIAMSYRVMTNTPVKELSDNALKALVNWKSSDTNPQIDRNTKRDWARLSSSKGWTSVLPIYG